ncbi:MAG: hypothetical protein NWF14_06030 [Candidatus Bathyarchaeota archaeon]|nr:hypothetical protein [Candidatus Bathyarchaeota archaeon]
MRLTESVENEKVTERGMLLRRAFSRVDLFCIGREMNVPYFEGLSSGWEIDDEDEASFEIASRIDDEELNRAFQDHKPRRWAIFRGRYYLLEDGSLSTEGFRKLVETAIRRVKARYGSDIETVLKTFIKCDGVANIEELKKKVKSTKIPEILDELERLKVIVTAYKGDKYQEWRILEETLPMVGFALGMRKIPRMIGTRTKIREAKSAVSEKTPKAIDHLQGELAKIVEMERELDEYLEGILKHRLQRTIAFGKKFDIGFLSSYLQELFGTVLYFDSLLSITQQYGLANIDIVHEHGKTGRRTGWSLALFGDPGTGKSFSTRDMILGSPNAKIGAHGLPGRNRYCGGMTPARFIRIGESYAGRVFNFIVPEFNDFFKYKGMVEPLKIAMEQGEIKYETHSEIVGPYRFTSFFAVNYNVSVHDKGYAVTIQDPNFNAIEDRMLCRLHRLTKERFVEITKSQMKLALGAIDIEKGAQKIRDHLTLVYAIEKGHPSVKGRFQYKPVMITPQVFEIIGKTRAAILERIPQRVVKFSARLEDKALRFACAASMMDYFHSDMDFIPVSEEALRYAVQLYVEEASVRSKEAFKPEEVLEKVFED